jgi:hypothetical protein
MDDLSWEVDGDQTCNDSICAVSLREATNLTIKISQGEDEIFKTKIKIYKNPIIEFEVNSYDGTFGFDNADYNALEESGDYENLSMLGYSNKDYYVPWVSIPNNNSIQLDINVRKLKRNAQKDDNFKVRFIPSASNISINNQDSLVLNYDQLNSQNSIQINVDGNTVEDFDNPDYIGVYNQNGKIIGKLAVIRKDKAIKHIHFIYVDNGNGTGNLIDHNTIMNFLNKNSHNQFFVKWKNIGVDTIQTNLNSTQTASRGALMDITGIYMSQNTDMFGEVKCFITDIEVITGGGKARGVTGQGKENVALFKNASKEDAAHEFGHLLGLPHTFCGNDPYNKDEDTSPNCINCVKRGNADRTITKSQSNNFMDYDNIKEAFYLYQWYYIINNVENDE